MRLLNIKGADEIVSNSPLCIQNPVELKGNWNNYFGNNNPIHIEVGMGKGQFITTLAKQHPEINYIGIEKYSSVLLRAVQKMEEEQLLNLKFILIDAKEITDVFDNEEVDRIYLNFSDPWPKDRHAKRRLPSRQFLSKFDEILKKDGILEFKTDNKSLFNFAVDEVEPAGWNLKEITYDLHNDEKMVQGNIMTEYEEKFSSMGNPIYKYIIHRMK